MRAFDRPVTVSEITNIIYENNTHLSIVFSELQRMEKEGLVERSGTSAKFYFRLAEMNTHPNYFYVFQNKSFTEEFTGGYLWAPKKANDGTHNHHWTRMQEVKKGDVILHGYKQCVTAVSIAKEDCYSAQRPKELPDEWNNDGWKIDSDYYVFNKPVRPRELWDKLKAIQPAQYAPFDKNGNGNMGYLFVANKQICHMFFDAIVESNLDSSKSKINPPKVLNNSLQLKIKEFNKIVHDGEDITEELRKEFTNDYNVLKLQTLKKEEYTYGLGKKDTFCYRVAHELQCLGSIRNGTPTKFGFYFGSFGKDQTLKYRTVSAFGKDDTLEDAEKAFIEVKRSIGLLLIAGTSNNYADIEKNPLSTVFKGKLLCIYFPDKYLNIYSTSHVHFFMDKLGIEYKSETGIMELQQDIIAWKNDNPIAKDWSNHEFSKFLYKVIGYPPKAKSIKKEIAKYENKIDYELVEDIGDISKDKLPNTSDYNPEPVARQAPVMKDGNVYYPRNRDIALKALKRAKYKCEIDTCHPSFIRKSNGTNYTEPHHLVPMSEQDRFEYSLDVPANIVSLCSNCHNRLHYGYNPDDLLKQLYDSRKDELKESGIDVSYKDLIEIYK